MKDFHDTWLELQFNETAQHFAANQARCATLDNDPVQWNYWDRLLCRLRRKWHDLAGELGVAW